MAKRKRKSKKNPSTEDRTIYRRQAAVEASVARAKLARAEQSIVDGNLFSASNLATEAAFDAGLSNGFALLSGDMAEQKNAEAILHEAQALQGGILNIPVEDLARTGNPQDGKEALKIARQHAAEAKGEQDRAHQVTLALDAAFYAGTAYGYGQATGDEKLGGQGMGVYQEMADEIPWAPPQQQRAANPHPAPVAPQGRVVNLSARKLKSRLLR